MANKGHGYAFLSGILLGVVGGVLVAPKKGEEMRRDIKIKGDEVFEKVASYDYSNTKDALNSKVDDFKVMIQDIDKDKVKDISLESLDNLKGKAEDLVTTAKKEVKKTLNKTTGTESTTSTASSTPEVEKVVVMDEDEDLFDDL